MGKWWRWAAVWGGEIELFCVHVQITALEIGSSGEESDPEPQSEPQLEAKPEVEPEPGPETGGGGGGGEGNGKGMGEAKDGMAEVVRSRRQRREGLRNTTLRR